VVIIMGVCLVIMFSLHCRRRSKQVLCSCMCTIFYSCLLLCVSDLYIQRRFHFYPLSSFYFCFASFYIFILLLVFVSSMMSLVLFTLDSLLLFPNFYFVFIFMVFILF
jgi:hypothetical protein